MPTGFPSDFPIYPCSRLIHGEKAPLCESPGLNCVPGVSVWLTTWETLDSLSQAHRFFKSWLNYGDWTCGGVGYSNCGSSISSGGYFFQFNRKSNPKSYGSMNVTSASGVTKIDLAL